jgi:hypothetical protein
LSNTARRSQRLNGRAGWGVGSGASVAVVSVAYFGRSSSDDPYDRGPKGDPDHCLESANCPRGPYRGAPLTAQRIRIRVTTPNDMVQQLGTVNDA